MTSDPPSRAFVSARCIQVAGETQMNARRRGTAAETAFSLYRALRTGDLTMAARLMINLNGDMSRLNTSSERAVEESNPGPSS